MREEAFRAFLAPRLGGATVVSSYLSNARLIEKRLKVDLDGLQVNDRTVEDLRARLIAAGVSPKRASDCISALRQYAIMLSNAAVPASNTATDGSCLTPATAPAPRHPALASEDVAGLMRLYGDLLAELADRGIARTANAPVGDYAEHLFATAYGWKRAANSEAGFDAHDASGSRYQIKGRRLATSGAARQLGAIRDLEDGFDTLALVLFDAGMRIVAAALVPRALVATRATFVARTNSWRMMAPKRLWTLPGVTDATDSLRAIE